MGGRLLGQGSSQFLSVCEHPERLPQVIVFHGREIRVLSGFQQSRRLPKHLLEGVPGGLLEGGIHVPDQPVSVGNHYAVGCLLNRAGQHLDPLLALFFSRHILENDDSAQQLTVLVP
jgi:hypothetical protein